MTVWDFLFEREFSSHEPPCCRVVGNLDENLWFCYRIILCFVRERNDFQMLCYVQYFAAIFVDRWF